MNNLLKLKRKDGVMVDTQLIELKLSDIDKIMELQEAIINGLENKEIHDKYSKGCKEILCEGQKIKDDIIAKIHKQLD